jgi:hypothetical protein
MTDVYGDTSTLETVTRFQDSFAAALRKVMEEGVEAAMKGYIADHDSENSAI